MNKKNIDDSINMSGNVNAQRRWGKIRDRFNSKRGTKRQFLPVVGDLTRSMSSTYEPGIGEELRNVRQRANAQAAADVFRDPASYPWSMNPKFPSSTGGYGAAPYPLLNGGNVLDVAAEMAFGLAPGILRGGAKRKKSKSKSKGRKSKSKSKGRKSKSKSKGRKSKGRKSKGRKTKGRKTKGRKTKGRKSKSKSKRK